MAEPDRSLDWTSQLPSAPSPNDGMEYIQIPSTGRWVEVPKYGSPAPAPTTPDAQPEAPSELEQLGDKFTAPFLSLGEDIHEGDLANTARTAARLSGQPGALGAATRGVIKHLMMNPLTAPLVAAGAAAMDRNGLIPETAQEQANHSMEPQGFQGTTWEGIKEGASHIIPNVTNFAKGAVENPAGAAGSLVQSLLLSPEMLLMPETPGLAASRVAMNAARAAKAGRAAEITAMALGKVAGDSTSLAGLMAGSEAVKEFGNTGELDPERITETAGSAGALGGPLGYLLHNVAKPTVRSLLSRLQQSNGRAVAAPGGSSPGESAGASGSPPGAAPPGSGGGGTTFEGDFEVQSGPPSKPAGTLPGPAVSYSLGELVQRAQDAGVDHEDLQPIMSDVLRKQMPEHEAKQAIGELINNAAAASAAASAKAAAKPTEPTEKPASGKTESTTAASPAAEASQPVSQEPVPVPDENGVVHTTVAGQPVSVNVQPSELQKAHGAYQKGHVTVQGLPITVENPKGTTRSGVDSEGKPWETTLAHDYGYIKRTVGADGEHVDTFIGPNPESDRIYVIDQKEPKGGAFDEVKAMVGFDSRQEAADAYHENYPAGWKGLQNITPVSVDEFKDWLKNGDTRSPFTARAVPAEAGASRTEEPSRVSGVAPNEGAVPESKEQAVPVLRGEGHQGVPAVADELRDVSQGSGPQTLRESLSGAAARGRELPAGERNLAAEGAPGAQPEELPVRGVSGTQATGRGLGEGAGAAVQNAESPPVRVPVERGKGTDNAGEIEPSLRKKLADKQANKVEVTDHETLDEGDGEQYVRARMRKDKAFKDLLTPLAHPSSGPAIQMLRGYEDSMRGVPLDEARIAKPSADMRPHGFNPMDFYTSGYLSHALGRPVDWRVLTSEEDRQKLIDEASGKEPAAPVTVREQIKAKKAKPVETPEPEPDYPEVGQGEEEPEKQSLAPGLVYHGSHVPNITSFNRLAGAAAKRGVDAMDTVGSWWSVDRKDASAYGEHVYEAALHVTNPLKLDSIKELMPLAKKIGATYAQPDIVTGEPSQHIKIAGSKLRAYVEQEGYDSIHIVGGERGHDYWIALHPEQVNIKGFSSRSAPPPGEQIDYETTMEPVADVPTAPTPESVAGEPEPVTHQKSGFLSREDRNTVSRIRDELMDKEVGLSDIRTVRKIYEDEHGVKRGASDKGLHEKRAEELTELAIVQAARAIVYNGEEPEQIFDELVQLYDRQPNLNKRTSTSIEQQAYSTPAPLAYLASHLAGINRDTEVLEPTAGNGMLLIGASPSNVTANELNPDRARILGDQGFHVLQADATTAEWGTNFDVVITNPPFGVVRESDGSSRQFTYNLPDGKAIKTTEIDHAIVMHALKDMKEDGKAVLIIGGVNKLATGAARSDAYNGAAKRKFFFALYGQYNVTDHFTVSGDLYSKQGAAWPVDVIQIQGRGKSQRALPAVDVPRVYNDWESLRPLLGASYEQPSGVESGAGKQQPRDIQRPVSPRTGAHARPVSEPSVQPNTNDAGQVSRPILGESDAGAATGGRRAPVRAPVAEEPERSGEPAGVVEPEPAGEAEPVGPAGELGGDETSGATGSAPGAGGGQVEPAGPPRELGKRRVASPLIEGAQQPYKPTSKSPGLDTLVPTNILASVDDALNTLQDQVGQLDAYVADELGYPVSDIPKYFAGEQVDALALGLKQMKDGKGFIIGDQTGIGKGRVVAGVIRWALKNGRTPIFVTEKPNLYKDMYRDLTDIGVPKITPIMTNGNEKVPLTDEENGPALKSAPSGRHNADLRKMAEDGSLGDYNMIFTTYNQMQTLKGELTDRMAFLNAFAGNGVVIFDESHNAGGNDAGDRGKKQADGETKTGRAAFARGLAAQAKGVFYSSATYAKRPSVMDLYFKTDMAMAVENNVRKLPGAIAAGGVPLQQAVAAQLTQAGQYVRRERSFNGVEYNTPKVPVDRSHAELISGIMMGVKEFDDIKKAAVKDLKNEAKAEAKAVTGSSAGADAESTNFTSVMHNVIDQMLLALKADAGADLAIEAIKRGEKPVITVSNTMGSFIQEYAENAKLKGGDTVALSFKDLLMRYLEKARNVTIKSPDGSKYQRRLTDEELGDSGVRKYEAVKKLIKSQKALDVVPISPIDWIHHRLREAGYKSAEITGRGHTLSYHGETKPVDYDKLLEERKAVFSRLHSASMDLPNAIDLSLTSKKTGFAWETRNARAGMDRYLQRKFPEEAHGETELTRFRNFGRYLRGIFESAESEYAKLRGKDILQYGTWKDMRAAMESAEDPQHIRTTLDTAMTAYAMVRALYMEEREKLEPALAKGGKKLQPTYVLRPAKELSIAGRNNTITNFNNGDIDAIILNQAGATGLSLHASKKFKDVRRRRMILVQAEKNIDTHMQILGRIDRSGQVVRGAYDQLVADIPAEKRQAAVLSKKMASLNANTTGARSSKFSASDAIDFINIYGDQAAAELMESLPEVHIKLGEPLEKAEGAAGYTVDEAARKVTGRLPLLPVAEQEAFYEIFQQTYQELLQRADAMGENALEAKTLDLDAKPVSKTELFPKQMGSESPFAAGSDAQVMDVKRLGKPFTSEQVKKRVAEHAGVPDMPFEMATRHASREWDQLQRATMQEYAAYRTAEEAKMSAGDMPETAQEGRLGMLDGQASRWQEKANFLEPGDSYLMKTPEGVEFYGVLSKIDRKKGIKLPVALGSWVAHFDVADGMRQITFPFSKISIGSHGDNQVSGVSLERASRNQMTGVKVMDMFDQGQTSSREKRIVVTGNLLAGFSKVRRGQIVNYTAHDGAIQQGVLMPRNFDLKEFAESQPVELSPDQVPRFFRNAQQGIVRTADGIMHIVEVGQGFKLSVPKSKAEGGKYFLDPDIRAVTGDFASQGSRMNVTVNQANLAKVTQILADKFNQRLYTDTFREEAIRAGGTALGGDALKKVSFARRPTLTLRQQMNPEVHDYLQKIAAALKDIANVYVHGTHRDFGRFIGMDVPDDVYGAYTASDGALHFMANKLTSVEQVKEIVRHEIFGHLAMERSPDFKKTLQMVDTLLKAGGKKIKELEASILKNYAKQKMDRSYLLKEIVAHMAEKGVSNAIVDRAITGVRDMLRKLGLNIAPHEAELRQMIVQAARGMPEDARKLSGIDLKNAHDVEKYLQAGQNGKAQDAMGTILPESEAIDALAYARRNNDPHAVLILKDVSADRPGDLPEAVSVTEEDAYHPAEASIPKGVLFMRHAPMDPAASAAKQKVMPGNGRDNLSLRDRIRLALKALANVDGLSMLQFWVDDQAALERYERMLHGSGKLQPGEDSPLKAARSVRNLSSQMAAVLEKGIPVYRDGALHVQPGRKGMKEIFAPLHANPAGSLVTHFELYSAARRASRLITEKNRDGTVREKNFDQAAIDAGLDLGNVYPELKQVFDDLQTMWSQLLDLGVRAGTIDPAARAIYEKHDYVPFYRLEGIAAGERDSNPGRARGGIANQREMSGHLTGKAAPLRNILENIVMNVANQIDAAQKNLAMQKVVDAYTGVFAAKVPKDIEAVKVSNDQVERAMKALGLNFDPQMSADQREMWSTFFRRVAPTDRDVIRVMRAGKPEYYRISDPLALDAITSLQGAPKWLRELDRQLKGMISGPKRFYTAMSTATPMYTARRFIRVMMDTWLQSNEKLSITRNAFKDFYDAIKGHPDLYDMMMAGSGGAQGYDQDPERVRDMMIGAYKDGNKQNFVLKAASPKTWWSVWRQIQQASKNEHMLRVYRAARAKGASVAEAAFRARDIEDLSMHGGGWFMQFINRSVPFLNARVQGSYRMVRGFKDNWKAYLARGSTVVMASLALQAYNWDNPRYQELPQWEKDLAWHFFVGEHHFILPKPFELGLIFATLPERIVAAGVHALDGKGGDTLGESIDAAKRALFDTFALNPMPQVLRPFYEQATNSDAFGNKIVTGLMDTVDPQEQSNAWTSPTARAIASHMPGSYNYGLNSPARLQALIQSITGSLGVTMLQGVDMLTRMGTGYGDAPSSSLAESAFRSFYQYGEPNTTKYTAELYDFMDQSNKALDSQRKQAEDGRVAKAQETLQSKEKVIEMRSVLNTIGKAMRDTTKAEIAVMHDPNLSGEEKEKRLKELTKQRNDWARQVAPFEEFF